MDFQPQVIAAVVGGCVAVLVIFLKERIERSNAARTAALVLLWLSKSLRRNLSVPPSAATHVDISAIGSSISNIASDEVLASIFDDIEEVIIVWRSGALERKDSSDPIFSSMANGLDGIIAKLKGRL